MDAQDLYYALSESIIFSALVLLAVIALLKFINTDSSFINIKLTKSKIPDERAAVSSVIKFSLKAIISIFCICLVFETLKLSTIKSGLTHESLKNMDEVLKANEGFNHLIAVMLIISVFATSLFIATLAFMTLRSFVKMIIDIYHYFRIYRQNKTVYDNLRSYDLELVEKGLDKAIYLNENQSIFYLDCYTSSQIYSSILIYGECHDRNNALIQKLSKLCTSQIANKPSSVYEGLKTKGDERNDKKGS